MASGKVILGDKPVQPLPYSDYVSRPYFPTLYVSKNEDDKTLQGLPGKGRAVVEYRVKSRTISEDENGKRRTSADIEIQSIEPLTKKLSELSAQIDAHLNEFAGELAAEGDPRPRNPMGQFAAGQTQGLDPMTMKQAYKKKRAPSLARIGAMAANGVI